MDTLANATIMVNDTIEYLVKSDVAAFYADMMDKQATQFTTLVAVICGVFAIAVGATWWWNYRGAKQQIKEEVGTAKQAMYKLYKSHQKAVDELLKQYETEFNGFKDSIRQSIDTQIDAKTKTEVLAETEKLKEHMDEVDKHSMQEIDNLKNQMINDITSQKAELCRIFALYCNNVKAPLTSVTWWIEALKNYAIIKNEEWVGRACESIVNILKDVDLTKIKKGSYDNLDEDIETIKQYLPATRTSDKHIILDKLNEIKKALSELK